MSVIIKLRNGRELDARPLDNDLFEATLASGKVKTYALADLVSVTTKKEAIVIANKEAQMTSHIHHYLHEVPFDGTDGKFTTIVRMGTTTLPTTGVPVSVAERYMLSVASKKVEQGIYAINTGAWRFWLLEKTLVEAGIGFTFMAVEKAAINQMTDEQLNKLIDKSTFCYANADYSFFLRIDGEEDFGLSKMGISIDFAKKSAKRLQELLRQSEMYLMLKGDEMDSVSIAFPEVAGDVEFYDGKTYIRKSLALKMAMNVCDPIRRRKLMDEIASGKLVQVTLRIMTPAGLFKGDAIIVPNKQISADVVTHDENLKCEMTTEDYMFFDMWEHSTFHMAVWDDQSSINFDAALPESAQSGDLFRLVINMRKIIDENTLPEWLLLGEDAHHDDGVPSVERLSTTVNKSWYRWQERGLGIWAAGNLTRMALSGVVNRMTASEKMNGFYKKTWIPMTNAALLTINTWESATRLGGFSFPNQTKERAFYDPRVGFILSGMRFKETYNYHGGWDLDDSMKVIIVKVWCSDSEILKQHLGKTIPAHVPYSGTKENAREMVLLVRSPNGPGEWSIEECDIASLPIPEDLRHDDVTVVDIAKMPLPQDLLLTNTIMAGMPTSTVYSKQEMTREDSKVMISAQRENPGIGRFCNAIMVWASANNGFPTNMLTNMETLIDTCQQGFDLAAFQAIEQEHISIMEQVAFAGNPIDTCLAMTRVNSKQRRHLSLTKGRFTRVHAQYEMAIQMITDELIMHTMQRRAVDPTVMAVKAMQFPAEATPWCTNFLRTYSDKLNQADAAFDAKNEKNAFRKMQVQYNHKLAMEAVVDEMVAEIDAFEERANPRILSLWKHIVSPIPGKDTEQGRLGYYDRIIFQPNKLGARSLMDVLIDALIDAGLAQPY